MSSPLYDKLDESYPELSTHLAVGKFQGPNYSTFTDPNFYEPSVQCFCQDGCPADEPKCGKCASEQFCNRCSMLYSAYCPSYSQYGGLGWL